MGVIEYKDDCYQFTPPREIKLMVRQGPKPIISSRTARVVAGIDASIVAPTSSSFDDQFHQLDNRLSKIEQQMSRMERTLDAFFTLVGFTPLTPSHT